MSGQANPVVGIELSEQQGTPLISQLLRVHQELYTLFSIAAQTPAGDSYDAAFLHLHRETNALAREFLRLSENLLATSRVEAATEQPALDCEIWNRDFH